MTQSFIKVWDFFKEPTPRWVILVLLLIIAVS